MEEGADNSNPSVGGSPDTAAIDAATATTAVAGFDFLDPRKPGYLARSRFKPSLRTRLPRMEGSHYPRPVWPRFSSVRRYVPISVLTVMVYVALAGLCVHGLQVGFVECTYLGILRSSAFGGVSLLWLFQLLHLGLTAWVALEFFNSSRDRRPIGKGQRWGYIWTLAVLGTLLVAFFGLGRSLDTIEAMLKEDDLSHPSLILRCSQPVTPSKDWPMRYWHCPVRLSLERDSPGTILLCRFFELDGNASSQIEASGSPGRIPIWELPVELRGRVAQAKPRWLFIRDCSSGSIAWEEVVRTCRMAFEAGFERVFLGGQRTRVNDAAQEAEKRDRIYSVAEILPVEPTGWRQGIGRENLDKGLVRVWVSTGQESPWRLGMPELGELGTELPQDLDSNQILYWVDWAYDPLVRGGSDRLKAKIEDAVAKHRRWSESNSRVYVWAAGKVPYSDIAPVVQVVSQTRWDPNRP